MPRSHLRGVIRPALCALALLAASAPVWSEQPQPVRHEYRIRHFRTEDGVELPEVRIVYGTYGHLNAAGDNAILLPSHSMAEMHGYAWLIGPGKALDPNKLFLTTSYEAAFIPHCQLVPIPSLWGHPAGAGASPVDAKFINEHVAHFLQ